MNMILDRKPDQYISTSALGAMGYLEPDQLIHSRIFLNSSNTTTSTIIFDQDVFAALDVTTSGVTVPSVNSTEETSESLLKIRKLTGLTWEQLSKLFNVSRRTLHFWASGKRLNSFNEKQLNLLLDTIQYIDRGSASLNRNVLLMPLEDGTLPFDLLVAGKFKKVKNILRSGNTPQRSKLNPLSEDALNSRKPISPENLVDALQEPIHRKVGRSRPAKSVRSRKNSSG